MMGSPTGPQGNPSMQHAIGQMPGEAIDPHERAKAMQQAMQEQCAEIKRNSEKYQERTASK